MEDFGIFRKRARLSGAIRTFFSEKDYLEVDTPILSPYLLPEPAIEIFRAPFVTSEGGEVPAFLVPSPEVWMKRLLAAGSGDIFQISKCFRNMESMSKIHNPEFTMLEWYSVGADYMDSAGLTEELVAALLKVHPVAEDHPLRQPFLKISMKEAFERYVSIDLDECLRDKRLFETARDLGLFCREDESAEELFNKIFLTLVEPELPADRPVVLYDYPALITTMAKVPEGSLYCERWELYIKGIEIANCYTEETDREKLKNVLIKEENVKKGSVVKQESDLELWKCFPEDFPQISGAAVGLDRLIMTILDIETINGVIFFPFSDIFKAKGIF